MASWPTATGRPIPFAMPWRYLPMRTVVLSIILAMSVIPPILKRPMPVCEFCRTGGGKGNNDQVIVANHIGREKSPVAPEVLQALKKLDLVKYYQNAMFIHSLPFIRELGLSSLIGTMGPPEISRFFNEFPGHILFRGHSHNPEIAWRQGRQVRVQSLSAGVQLNLSERIPCVVTCGALTRGLCMIWNPEENYIESLLIR